MSKRKLAKPSRIRVALADKSPLVQAALTHLFAQDARFDLVATFADSESFLQALNVCQPDVAVCGWVLPPGDGKYLLDQLRGRAQAPPVVVYTGAEGHSIPVQVMAHGGAAFVSKSEQLEFLLDTVAAAAEGRMNFPFLDIRKINQNPLRTLTKRELEVLSALAAGQMNKEIAANQGVSANTIKFHIKNLFEKLGVNNRAQATALYLKS